MRQGYYKVEQILQNETDITNRALHSPEVHQGVSQKRSLALYNSSYMCEGTQTLTRYIHIWFIASHLSLGKVNIKYLLLLKS